MAEVAAEQLSTTDYAVLGLVWRDGPCTPYNAMVRMAESPTTFYRRRASSTYRVVQRLIDLGYIEQVEGVAGPRGDHQVRATDSGHKALRKWLSPPLSKVEVAHSNDLIRQRFNFITALSKKEREAFIEDALTRLEELAEDYKRIIEKPRNQIHGLAAEGGLLETQARIEWLQRVRRTLK